MSRPRPSYEYCKVVPLLEMALICSLALYENCATVSLGDAPSIKRLDVAATHGVSGDAVEGSSDINRGPMVTAVSCPTES